VEAKALHHFAVPVVSNAIFLPDDPRSDRINTGDIDP
jgi:hypothetical protein